jgi:hypothetical protein
VGPTGVTLPLERWWDLLLLQSHWRGGGTYCCYSPIGEVVGPTAILKCLKFDF